MKTVEELRSEMRSENFFAAFYAAKELQSRAALSDVDFVGTVISRESLTSPELDSWDRMCRASGRQ